MKPRKPKRVRVVLGEGYCDMSTHLLGLLKSPKKREYFVIWNSHLVDEKIRLIAEVL